MISLTVGILVYCSMTAKATKSLEQHITSASSKFITVHAKPSTGSRSSVESGRQHLRQCMKDCLMTGDCLTTVFDEVLGLCSLYNSSLLTQSLGSKETAVTAESTTIKYQGKEKKKLFISGPRASL